MYIYTCLEKGEIGFLLVPCRRPKFGFDVGFGGGWLCAITIHNFAKKTSQAREMI
jgi:hypothetical protein